MSAGWEGDVVEDLDGVGEDEVVEMGYMTYLDVATHALRESCGWVKVGGEARESCGLLVSRSMTLAGRRLQYVRALNVAAEPSNSFIIDPEVQYEVAGWGGGVEVVGMVHSHPNGEGRPSPWDLETYVPDGYLYGIVGLGSGQPVLGMYRVVRGDFVRCQVKLV